MAEALLVDGREVAFPTPERLLFPDAGFRKRDLADYYLAVAPALLPHLRGRPLTLGRLPDGIGGRGFYQNECRGHPPWMRVASLELRDGGRRDFCLAEEPAALVWLAGRSTVELHPYPVDAQAPDEPVALVLDLDPGPGAGLVECCDVALRLRELLARQGLAPAVKTSGGAGLHLALAVRDTSFAETKAFARALARRLAAETPELVTDVQRRDRRAGRVLVDWLQNEPRRSTVAPYSPRAARLPRVSTPLSWDEVEDAAARRDAGGLGVAPADVPARLERAGDLYAAGLSPAVVLPAGVSQSISTCRRRP